MKIKVKIGNIASNFLALVGICGIGYTLLDQLQEVLTIYAVVCLIYYSSRNLGVRPTKTDIEFIMSVVFFILIVFSFSYSIERSITLKYVLRFLLITMLTCFTFDLSLIQATIKKISQCSFIVAITVILSAVAPAMFKSAFGWFFANKAAVYSMLDQRLAVGIVGHNAYAACISNICIGSFLAHFFAYNKARRKDWIMGGIGMLAVLVTGKRILLVSMVVAIGVLFFMRCGKKLKMRAIKITCVGLFAILLLFLFVPASRRILERIIDGMGDTSFNNRKVFWTEAMYLFNQKKIFGWGFGIFPYYDKKYGSGWGYSAHNQYFEVIAELGIVGIFVFVLLVLLLLRCTVKLIMNKSIASRPEYLAAVMFVFFYQVWYVVYGLTGTPLYNYSQHLIFMLLSVFSLSLKRNLRADAYNRKKEDVCLTEY